MNEWIEELEFEGEEEAVDGGEGLGEVEERE